MGKRNILYAEPIEYIPKEVREKYFHGEEKRIRAFVARYPWTFAKTYADCAPHEYYVKDKLDEQGKKTLSGLWNISETMDLIVSLQIKCILIMNLRITTTGLWVNLSRIQLSLIDVGLKIIQSKMEVCFIQLLIDKNDDSLHNIINGNK